VIIWIVVKAGIIFGLNALACDVDKILINDVNIFGIWTVVILFICPVVNTDI
jgi:hypothetical protein